MASLKLSGPSKKESSPSRKEANSFEIPKDAKIGKYICGKHC